MILDSKGKPVTYEVATTADGRDITRGFVDPLQPLVPQDKVLAERAQGDYGRYEELLRDDQVASTFQQRRFAVISREWDVEPGGTSRIDKKAADFTREVLKNIEFDSITDKMLFGVFYGYGVGECLWARDGGNITIEAIKVRKQRRFRFGADGQIRLLTAKAPQGEILPPRKFWTFATGADNDDEPYGLGLAHWVYWPVFFKRNGLKFWLIFLEKFGQPTALGKYSGTPTPEEKAKLLAALAAIHTDSGIILPEGMAIELIEAARSGTVDYVGLYDRMDRAISKVVVGQTMTTDSGSSRSQAEVHLEVRGDLVKADADLVCKSFNSGPLRWLTQWNFPGAKPPVVWRDLSEALDRKSEAETDKVLFDLGFRRTLKHVQETYGGEWEPTVSTPPAPTKATAPPAEEGASEFAEGTESKPVSDVFAEQLDDAASGTMDVWIERVRRLIDESGSLEEASAKLLDLYGELDPGDLADLMHKALVAADIVGRDEVNVEVGDADA